MLRLLKPARLELVLCRKSSHCNEKPTHCNDEQPPHATTRESPHAATETHHSQKKKLKDSALPLQGTLVQSLVRELRSCMSCSQKISKVNLSKHL